MVDGVSMETRVRYVLVSCIGGLTIILNTGSNKWIRMYVPVLPVVGAALLQGNL